MIKLYWCPQTRAMRALWLMEETGLPYERVLIDIRDPDKPRDPDFAKASPMGKVPALSDGPVHLADSAAIGLYIADRYPETRLAPAIDDAKRGDYLYWMIYTPGVIEPAMGEKISGTAVNKTSHGWGDFDSMINVMEKGVKDSPWLLGDQFSAADVMIGSSILFLKRFGLMPVSDILDAYADRCLARPALQKTMEIEAENAS
ncbi:MAG: glutathione S-transferase family protein [Alphaproteobacteria bacterium]|nr:MAG: glutathione S-transferase family protein [Alphaproteobacteria bacterium]